MASITNDIAETSLVDQRSSVSVAEPCAIVIFGASGDLTRRKLIPALFELAACQSLARRFAIIGFARSEMSDANFQQSAADAVRQNNGGCRVEEEVLRAFVQSFVYVAGDYDRPAAFEKLAHRLDEIDRERNLEGNRLYYLATPPAVYPKVIAQIKNAGMARPVNTNSWARIVIEKPFGHDLASARKLNRVVLDAFDESQVYRIDHFLGKDTVQNLLALRFGNGIFEPLWNRNYVDHVQITAAESLGVEQRAAFYETTGALRDMVQSHVLQLTCLAAMEPPSNFDATAARNEKLKVLQALRPYSPDTVAANVVAGQYAQGEIDGQEVAGYREEPGVTPSSTTDTYVAAKVLIDNWRWADVPFYIRTGKRMRRRVTEVAINFRRAPHLLFRGQSVDTNTMVLNIQPEEGISIGFHVKLPGQQMRLAPAAMDFSYLASFGASERSAYATLLNDCMRGDATLFDRADGVEAAWAFLEPVLDVWEHRGRSVSFYPAGSWGPREADDLLSRDGRRWRTP
ncbi:MAG TPA: glucose-6-phosphate dehydrogenase [Candidatus Acidoferrales bacterium]|jgi:glucose-6-phosphate 1-dehydrogenase|nr:glucose-6-phosphate dehydrogenase [Candidatus Acidoferrales bacterium]